jgi:hypothetical protein
MNGLFYWRARTDLNRQPLPYEGRALPLELLARAKTLERLATQWRNHGPVEQVYRTDNWSQPFPRRLPFEQG